jgi:hypothetical protein
MTAYNFGDVVLLPFPFTDQTTTKNGQPLSSVLLNTTIIVPMSLQWL